MLWWTYSFWVLAAIHTMNQPLKGKTEAVAQRHVCPFLGFHERFDDFAAHLPLENVT